MDIKDIKPGQQYMIRKYADSRRVRVEVESIVSHDGVRTVIVQGRHVRQGRRISVGSVRSWSTYPEMIEEVAQI